MDSILYFVIVYIASVLVNIIVLKLDDERTKSPLLAASLFPGVCFGVTFVAILYFVFYILLGKVTKKFVLHFDMLLNWINKGK